jgi:hypothetical protein
MQWWAKGQPSEWVYDGAGQKTRAQAPEQHPELMVQRLQPAHRVRSRPQAEAASTNLCKVLNIDGHRRWIQDIGKR